MLRELIQHGFAFNHWANRRLLALLSQLPDDVLNADDTRFYSGSAWGAVKHLVDVEWSWLRCSQGLDMKPYVWDLHPFGSIREANTFVAEEYPRVEAYVANLSDADYAEMLPINSANPDIPPPTVARADLLMHILNHGTEHRGDLAHFLTDRNLSPGDLDYLDYLQGVHTPEA
jgi:uncharacterized damage-inducible protein DinB